MLSSRLKLRPAWAKVLIRNGKILFFFFKVSKVRQQLVYEEQFDYSLLVSSCFICGS